MADNINYQSKREELNSELDVTTNNAYANNENINPADRPMPDPERENAIARAKYEAKHGIGDNDDTTTQAGADAFNPTMIKLASDRRDASRASSRANEATDPNDTGSGGIPAGGVKSGSSLQ